MSLLTAVPLKVSPSAANPTTVSFASAWTYGSWVEYIASAPANLALAGLTVDVSGASTQGEIDIGVGAAASEVSIATFRWQDGGGSSGGGNSTLLLPAPIDNIPSGSRLALRMRSSIAGGSWDIKALYYEDLDSDQKTTKALRGLPSGASNTSLTPNGTAWVNSAWVELTSGIGNEISLVGIGIDSITTIESFEVDIGLGGAGSEVVATTVSGQSVDLGLLAILLLPAVYPVAASTRVSVRLRKTGTSTTAWGFSLLYYDVTALLAPVVSPPTGGGVSPPASTDPAAGVSLCTAEVPLSWWEIDTGRVYAKVAVNIDGSPKEPRVETMGTVRRALSNQSGDLIGSTVSPILIDTDRTLRDDEDADSLVGARASAYLSTEAAIRAGTAPRRVFDGKITDSEPLDGLRFQLQITDYLTYLLDQFSKKIYPQRLFTLTDFPNMGNDPGDLSSPGNPGMVNKPVGVGYGLLSDEALGALAGGVVPGVFTGRKTLPTSGTVADEYVFFGHAPASFQSLFVPTGPGLSVGTAAAARMKVTTANQPSDYIFPGTAQWAVDFGTDTYVDINSRRYTVAYGYGPRSELNRTGQVPLLANLGGVEDVGDGTGDLIDSIYQQCIHLLTNFVLQNYTSGAWLGIPTVGTGGGLYSRINTASFDDCETRSAALITGGILGAFLVGGAQGGMALLEILKQFALAGHFEYGISKDGQIMAAMFDPAAVVNRTILDVGDIVASSYRVKRRRDKIRNTVTYRSGRRYAPALPTYLDLGKGNLVELTHVSSESQWEYEPAAITDSASVTKHGERTADLSFEFLRDADIADVVAQAVLDEDADGPVAVTFTERLCGTSTELGDADSVTHFEGLSLTARSMRCQRHALDLDAMTVEKEYREL